MTRLGAIVAAIVSVIVAIAKLAGGKAKFKERAKAVRKDSDNASALSDRVAYDRRVRAARGDSDRGYRD